MSLRYDLSFRVTYAEFSVKQERKVPQLFQAKLIYKYWRESKKKMFANCDALNINESEHDDTCALSKNRSTQSDQSLRFVLHD